jgi:hypothetical protein
MYNDADDISYLNMVFGYTTKFVGNDYMIELFGDFYHEYSFFGISLIAVLEKYLVEVLKISMNDVIKVVEYSASLDFTKTNRRLHVILKGDWRNK